MDEKHKIILSMYYIGMEKTLPPDEEKFNLNMDMEQLLFLINGVFNEVHYKYLVEDCSIRIVPQSDYVIQYLDLVDQSRPLYQKAHLLKVLPESDLNDYPYEQIDRYQSELPHSKDHLYFLNILFNHVNSTGELLKRENVAYNFLFDIKRGKNFLGGLIAMILDLLISYRDGGCGNAKMVMEALNQGYVLMKELFDERDRILSEMQFRNRYLKERYRNSFFINQASILNDWVHKHQQADGILGFVFYQNDAMKNCAVRIMQHIAKISGILMKDECIAFHWDEERELRSVRKIRSFYHLDQMIDKLEREYGNSSFDVSAWIDLYVSELYQWALVNLNYLCDV